MHVRVMCLCFARVCTVVLRALSVCTVVHVVPFRAWGWKRVGVPGQRRAKLPHPNPKGRHDPTAK